MKLEKEILKKIFPQSKNVDRYIDLLNAAFEEYAVNTSLRISHFLAQIAVESAEMNTVIENLNYSSLGLLKTFPKYFNVKTAWTYARKPVAIASRAYANRLGNGDEESGDGWKYRGRGLIQVTGKAQYTEISRLLNKSLEETVSYLETPEGAVFSAVWYWHKTNLNKYADRDDIGGLTRAVNAGMKGLKDRKIYLDRAKKFLM